MKNFGFTSYDQVDYLGTNGKMNEISAAMGLTNLESMDRFIDANRRHHELYREEFAGLEGVSVVTYNEEEKCNYQYVVIEVEEERTSISRDQLLRILHAENVLARRYFYPGCHRMEPYKSRLPLLSLPATERVCERVLSLPTGTAVSPVDISAICGIIRIVLKNGREVSAKL